MNGRILVFDVDGVLVDVTESYREAIGQTVERFAGRSVSPERIQNYKNRGGWNNDWELSHDLIKQFGVEVPLGDVIDYFNEIFLGPGGLLSRERWVARDGLLGRLAARYQLAIFTGRLMVELQVTLDRFARDVRFDPMITTDSGLALKPSPEGLLEIARRNPRSALWYVGDSVDDARSARQANVPFIGIAAPLNPLRSELVELFHSENAIAVLDDINQLEGVLPL